MGKELRKFNRATHRDLGYFFVGMILIYSISGIAINHLDDWNPNYNLTMWDITTGTGKTPDFYTKQQTKQLLEDLDIDGRVLKVFTVDEQNIKVFFKGGTLVLNTETGRGQAEELKRRPLFHAVNWLHYNPNVYWKWFSDIFAVALILLSITGMFILKGKNGLKWRGAILISTGIIVPLVFLFLFYF